MTAGHVTRRRLLVGAGVGLLALTGRHPVAGAAETPPRDRMVISDIITPPDGTNDFGHRVVLSGDGRTAAMVQAPFDWENPSVRPGVIVTTLDATRRAPGWSRSAELLPGIVVDGVALSADGSVLTVGSAGSATVTVLRRGTDGSYRVTGRFGPVRQRSSSFGGAVALSAHGGVLLVGAPSRNQRTGYAVGGVYRYLWTGAGWRWGGLLDLSAPRLNDRLGSSVAVSGDGATVLASSPYRRPQQDSTFVGSGIAVVYRAQ